MSKAQKKVICSTCNNTMPSKSKVCPSCGAKHKKPIYKKWWFIALMALVIICVVVTISSNSGDRPVRFSWDDMKLGSLIPEPKSHIGRIVSNYDDRLCIYIKRSLDEDYEDYIYDCQDNGYIIESEKSDARYSAYNEDGYKLTLSYYSSDKEFRIELDAPIDMDTIMWPASDLVSLLPVPKSTFGVILSEKSDRFLVHVGETSFDDYLDYVDECSNSGFSVDCSKGDKYYYAYNEDGYHLEVRYRGNNVMSIVIESPDEETNILQDNLESNLSTSEPSPNVDEEDDAYDLTPDSSGIEEPVQDDESNVETSVVPADQGTAEASEAVQDIPSKSDESTEGDTVYYSTNNAETVKRGKSGVYAYRHDGSNYDLYWIIDFDEGYAYYFTFGNDNSICDKVEITSGNLNEYVVVTYHDGSDSWEEGLRFKWKNQPLTMVFMDGRGNDTDYVATNLKDALDIRSRMDIVEY